jgi:hypothetical protein
MLRGSPWSADARIRDIADIAYRESESLPATDQVHGFLDLLDRLARMDP